MRRGEHRKAVQALRQLADRDGSAGAWVRLGVQLARSGKFDAAIDAFKQGQFLHRRAGCRRRAEVVARLIERVDEAASNRKLISDLTRLSLPGRSSAAA